jgi:hypothetical protein
MASRSVDLDDTGDCPLGDLCSSCGAGRREGAELLVRTIGSPLGVFCVTMCVVCIEWDDFPNLALVTAIQRTLDHCRHLGIDADEMAMLMEKEQAT